MKNCFLLIFSLIFWSISIQAQNKPNKNLPTKECSAPLARQLVEQQAIESRSVSETDRRIKILLRVADFLWRGDEDASRKYFAEAFQVAQTRFKNKEEDKSRIEGLITYTSDYRFDVIANIAKYDAEWAKKLSEAVLKEFDEDTERAERNDLSKDHEADSLLRIAARMAKDNPNLSLTFARRAMKYPLSSSWYWTLFQMAEKNQALADQIYGELLTNYANAEVSRLLYLSAYPFGQQRIFGLEKYTMRTSLPDNFAPNPNLKRQFLPTLLRRIIKLTPESAGKSQQTDISDSASAAAVLPEFSSIIREQLPELAQMYEQAGIHANSIVDAETMRKTRDREEADKKFNNPFEMQLEELEKSESEGKLQDSQIFRLINSAKTEEQYKRAESWIDKITEDVTREGMTNSFNFRRSKLAIKEKRFDDARKYALKVPLIQHRAVLFFDIAEGKLKEPMTKLESLETLLEVYQTALKAPDTVEKAQVLLGTAFMYEKIDHYNALSSLADAIKIANKLENPNLLTSSITQIVRGEGFTSYSTYQVPGFDVTETFYALSKRDFQGALGNSTSFTDKYLRTLAVLATVKDCELNETPNNKKTRAK